MNHKKSFFHFLSLMLGIFFLIPHDASSQNFQKINAIEYLQLPGIGDTYMYAKVFLELDNAVGLNQEVSMALKNQAKKVGGEAGEAMEKAISAAMDPKTEPYGTWKISPPHFNNGNDQLKVVITYTPDNKARPMGTPMKNNKGLYVVAYKVHTHLKVFDAKNKVIMDRNFGIVSGTGYSKEWPAPQSGSGGLTPTITVEKEGEETTHPYEKICLEGALEQAEKVVYGMFGIKRFYSEIGVYWFKELKESKEYSKMYTDLMEAKQMPLPNEQELSTLKKCADYWESIAGKIDKENAWALHHNLAVVYSWLLDDAKSKEHFKKLTEMHAPTFEKINKFFTGKAESKTLIKGKEINMLEVYNACQPFLEYYADGINKHPTWPAILMKPYEEILYALTMNTLIAGQSKSPFPLPVYPVQNLNGSPKACDGQIFHKGEALIDFKYAMKKGIIEVVDLKASKGKGKYDKSIPFGSIFEDGSDEGSFGDLGKHKSRFTLVGTRQYKNMGVSPKGYYIGNIRFTDCIAPLPFELQDLKYWELTGEVDADFCSDAAIFKKYILDGQYYFQHDSWDKCAGKIEILATKMSEKGYPEELSMKWRMNGYHNTGTGNSFLEKNAPGAKMDTKVGAVLYEKTDTYPMQWKFDDKGNWIEIIVGDSKVTRTFKY
jgi:hypothetical protein